MDRMDLNGLSNMTVCYYKTFADITVFEEVDRNYAVMLLFSILFCVFLCLHAFI